MAKVLSIDGLPTEVTLGGHTYEVLPCHQPGEKYVKEYVMLARANNMGARHGREECNHLLQNQAEIPAALCGVMFVFTGDYVPGYPERVYYVAWVGSGWARVYIFGDDRRVDRCRVLRRKIKM